MKKLFSTVLLLCATCMQAQDIKIPKNRIPVQCPDFFAWVEVYEGDVKTSSLENNRTYFWLKAKQVHSSKGGYEGDLLHGEYTALYKNDALKEKGTYYKGLKNGEWKEWYPSGELKLISHWKKGIQRGNFFYYDEKGRIIRKEWYRDGSLHGKQFSYSDSTESFVKYSKGKLVKSKTKQKKVKAKIEPGEEIPLITDTSSQAAPRKKGNRLFNKSKKENIPENPEEEKTIKRKKERKQSDNKNKSENKEKEALPESEEKERKTEKG